MPAAAPLPPAADPALARALWDRATRLRAAQQTHEAAGDTVVADSFDFPIARALSDAVAAGAPPAEGAKND